MPEQKTSQSEKLTNAFSNLENAVREMYESGRFEEYISVFSKFHHYSFGNILLAYFQFPNLTKIASFATWKAAGLRVRPGEKGIAILCPVPHQRTFRRNRLDQNGHPVQTESGDPETEDVVQNYLSFKIGYVFDVSQCDGELPSIISAPTDNTPELNAAVQELMTSDSQIMYDEELIGSDANGFFSPITQEIHIKPGMSDLQTLRCIAHEYSHKLLHSDSAARELERGIKEIEAEASSYLVCSALGFPQTICYSAGYLAGWSKSRTTKELLDSVQRIQYSAETVLKRMTTSTSLQAVG